MVHEDYKEMIPARALSALDAAEERALNEHLENCSECRTELEQWQATAAALSLAPDPAEPSPEVRQRILSEVRKDLSSAPEVIPFRSAPRNIWSSFGTLGSLLAINTSRPVLSKASFTVPLSSGSVPLNSTTLAPGVLTSSTNSRSRVSR